MSAMNPLQWHSYFEALRANEDAILKWAPEPPNPSALLCAESRHRTLGHLRACQEQWWTVAHAFATSDQAKVTILHPWRKFEKEQNAFLPWDEHLKQFLSDRQHWYSLECQDIWDRAGTRNRRTDTIGGLVRRLAMHESNHIEVFKERNHV